MTKFDLYGLFMDDEDLKGRSDLALGAFSYGFVEESILGTHALLSLWNAAEQQAEQEFSTPEESFELFLNAYHATSAPINNLADSMRMNVMDKLQSGVDEIDLDTYYSTGTYGPLAVGAASILKSTLQVTRSSLMSRGASVYVNSSEKTLEKVKRVGRAKNNMRPYSPISKNEIAPGSHSTFKRDPKTGKITHYATWRKNINGHPSDPHPFKLHKEHHGTSEDPKGHFMKHLNKYSGNPHMHRMRRNPINCKIRELIDLPKQWEIPK